MATIDLGPPRPTPHDLLDGLPRRVALTLPELRFAAIRANGAPLPFDLRESDEGDGGLDDRLGGSRGSPEQAAYAEALARLHDPAASLSRRGLLVGGPDDGVVEEGLVGAIGLLATPTVAIDLDVAAGRRPGQVVAPAERRRGRGAVDAGRAGLRAGVVPDLGLGGRAGSCRRRARGPAVARLGRPRPGRPPSRAGRRRHRGGPHPPHRPRPRAGGAASRWRHRRLRSHADRR